MTKGTSTRRKNRLPGSLYGNFDPGNEDKLMITYRREPSMNYTMNYACSVNYQGEMHFFGGRFGLKRQHFVIETKRSGKLVQMTQLKDLEIDFELPSCISYETGSDYFSWISKNIVILCFTSDKRKSCYSFDGELAYIGDSNFDHSLAGLAIYNSYLLTVGCFFLNQKTEAGFQIDAPSSASDWLMGINLKTHLS